MVGVGDLKLFKSASNGLGGAISATQIASGTFNNLFGNVPQPEQATGEDYYLCMYAKNTHGNESMDSFNFWLGTDTIPADTKVRWGFDNSPVTGYRWTPNFTSTGSNTDETADAAEYDLSVWTVACWFKVSTAPGGTLFYDLVNKGGYGSSAAGENLNYGIAMNSNGTMQAGFETGAGVTNFVNSPLPTSYADGAWHFALAYYSGTSLQLFVDNMTTAKATLATTSTPETNAKPIRINQNSRASNGWMPSGGQIDEVRIWNRAMTDVNERTALYTDNTSNSTGLVLEKKFGADVFIGVAQTIPNFYTNPSNVTWFEASVEPTVPNVGRLAAGDALPVWVWWHVDAGAIARKDDKCIFNFSFNIPSGGTGDPGSGGGGGTGTLTVDQFGIRQIYATASGGRTYYSNWHLESTTTHSWDSSAQEPGQLDPQDDMADLVAPTTCRATVDASNNWLIADTNSDRNSWRYYIKDPAATTASSPWKWSESMEITAYYRAIKDYSGGSIHVHLRLMGPTEHWIAISDCGAAGHEYSYEIKKNTVNQFRKEEVHVGGDAGGYADNIVFDNNSAPYNVWVGMKLVTKLVDANTMHIEAWRDDTDGLNGGTWVKQEEITDDGTNWTLPSGEAISNFNGLPAGTGNCTKISPMDRALTMDCTAFGLRVDNTQVQIKKFSGREIDPADPGQGGSGGSSGGGGGGGGTGGNPPPVPTDYKIAVSGDWGCESATDDVIALINGNNYDFVVGVGDNAYASSSCWTGRFAQFKPNFNSAYGNHEYEESGGITPYKTFFGHSLTYFTFKFQNILFVVADTNINCDVGSAQHNALKAAIEAAASDSNIKWKIAVMHHPFFGASSNHGYNDVGQVEAFHQLFMQHKFSFVCVGHNHNWQRTKQVAYNAGNPEQPTALVTSSPYVATTSGLIHVVTGAGGHDSGGSLYSLGSQPSFQAFQNRTHNGVWEIVASNNGLTWTCSFVEIGGDKFDTFIITTT